ncbi:MAG: SCP2 sterol-binding domain-containing protein [Planctomycetes bacterium]|nr:SCP2 sterol-binding domain-containing protein [Planctomycetota bacterium]
MSERLIINDDDRNWLGELGLSSVRSILRYRPATAAALSGSSDTFPIDLDLGDAAPKQVFVKRYRYRSLAARLKGVFRGTFFGTSRARFEYEFLTEMRNRGVAAVRPIAFGEKRRAGLLTACVLITEGVADAESLDAYARRAADGRTETSDTGACSKRRRRAGFIDALARSISQLHEAGVMHGGLFWRNILVSESGAQEWRFHFLDPDRRGSLRAAPLPRRAVVSDLADLFATAEDFRAYTDVVQFARCYFNTPRLTGATKAKLREIIERSRTRVNSEAHRVAVSETISRIGRRMKKQSRLAGRQGQSTGAFAETVDSAAEFFDALARIEPPAELVNGPERRIAFDIRPSTDSDGKGAGTGVQYALVFGGGGFSVCPGMSDGADLLVTADEEAWLAIVNGRSNVFDMIRDRRVTVKGDSTQMPKLAELIGL